MYEIKDYGVTVKKLIQNQTDNPDNVTITSDPAADKQRLN
jgi:hypothetical protein